MRRMLSRIEYLCVIIWLGITIVATDPCVKKTPQCVPIAGPESNNICLYFLNGTGVTWFQAKNECESGGGRLAHVGNYSTERGLVVTAKHRNVRLGVLVSLRGDAVPFMRNSNDVQCTTTTTRHCSSTTSPLECAALGCCFQGGICQYPENQCVSSLDLNVTSNSSTGTERSCVQLNKDRSWNQFNCSEPGGDNTSYACEKICSTHWPDESYKNVTWLAPAGMSSGILECTVSGLASHSSTGNTSTAMYHPTSDGAATGLTTYPISGASSPGMSSQMAENTSVGLVSHPMTGDASGNIQGTTSATVKATSSEENQSVACQFNVQILWLTILTAMPMMCL